VQIAVIEDCPEEQALLQESFKLWSKESKVSLDVDWFTGGEAFLGQFTVGKYKLLFIDIYLEQEMTGIEMARQVREQDIQCLLVFLTASREHVWDSFPLHPFDYLVKPLEKEQLFRVLREAGRMLAETEQTLELTYKRQKLSISYRELVSLEADGHYVVASVWGRSSVRCYISSFAELWELLGGDARFLMCNRGIILNMDYVEKMLEQDFLMKDGRVLPIRQNNCSAVRQQFLSYQYELARKYGKRRL